MRLKFLFFVFLLVGVFGIFKIVQATGYSDTLIIGQYQTNQPSISNFEYTTYVQNATAQATTTISTEIGAITWGATSTASSTLRNIGLINSISVYGYQNSGHSISDRLLITCSDFFGLSTANSDFVTIPNSTSPAVITYHFSTPFACQFNSSSFQWAQIEFNSDGGDLVLQGAYVPDLNPSFSGDGTGMVQSFSSGHFSVLNQNFHLAMGINDSLIYLSGLGSSSGISACDSTDFEIFSVDYGQGLCKVFRYLFYPSSNTTQNFSNLWDTIKVKPPFGYFTVYESQIATTTASSTPTESFNPAIPTILTAVFTPLDLGIGALVFFLTAWWFYHRGRNITI